MSHGKRSRIEKLRGIVENCQHAKVEGVRVDLFTASALVRVYEALSPENQARFNDRDRLPLPRLVAFAWQHVRSGGHE